MRRALTLGFAILLTSLFTFQEALAQDVTQSNLTTQSATKKKKKKKKKSKKSAGITIDTSMPVTSSPRNLEASDDLGILPMDVEHMLFDSKSIQDVIKHHMPQIQACYEKVLATSAQPVEGKVMVAFTIDVSGSVVDVKPLPKKSTLTDVRAIDCVVNRVRRLVFPKPSDNRRYPIEFPFNLTVKK